MHAISISFVLMTNIHILLINGVTNDLSFDKRTRLISTTFEEPFMMLKKDGMRSYSEQNITDGTILDPTMVKGYYADLAYALCHEKLKIPYKFRIATTNNKDRGKGVWDDIIGTLVNRSADLAIASLTITAERQKKVDFSQPFINFGISIMTKKPQMIKPSMFYFLTPFSMEIWMCLLGSYILVNIVLCCVNRLSSNEVYSENENERIPRHKLVVYNAPYFLFPDSIYQRAACSVSGRFIIRVWWFFCFIIFATYLASVSVMAPLSRKLVMPVESFEDLPKQTEVQYGVLTDGAILDFFNKSTLPTIKHMWNVMEENKHDSFIASIREGIEKVRRRQGRFVFLVPSILNDYVNQRSPCDTIRVDDIIGQMGYGIATPFGSDLRQAINIALLELQQTGFFEQLKQKWYNERNECTYIRNRHSTIATAAILPHVSGIFYILLVTLGIALFVAFIEFFINAKHESTRLNQNLGAVTSRNLRFIITGQKRKRNAQPTTMTSLNQPPTKTDETIVNESTKFNIDHTSHP